MCFRCDALAGSRVCDAAGPAISRRRSLDFLAAGGLAAWLASQPSIARAADDETVRIGYLPITDAAALLVAYAKGFLTDEGLKADKPTLIRAWPTLVESFAAQKFNLVHLLNPIPIWMRYNNHVPVKLMAWAHTNGSALTVGGKSDIKSFADLGGKRIAVPFWYSTHNILLQMALRKYNITPVITGVSGAVAAHECALEILGPPDMLPALASGKIDGYIVAEPFNAMGEVALGARILRFTGDMWQNHPCCVVCMHEPEVTKNPARAQKIMNAIVRAEAYIGANRAEVATLLSKDGAGFLPMPAKAVLRAMTLYNNNPAYHQDGAIKHPDWPVDRIDFSPYPYPSATTFLVEQMGKTKVAGDSAFLAKLDPAFVAKDLVDYRFVETALKAQGEAGPFSRREVIEI
ncbi:MAG: ABC transporter substrate-binding protein [Rhodospirillales bacterium 20-60-12]|nr:MAG: ABC transporter substrate-binding protein [Rhodospirillales bacterium 20-60-12]HQT68567.1 ABC transporter substrate-binding protein [Acetobacteraceae bacterium]